MECLEGREGSAERELLAQELAEQELAEQELAGPGRPGAGPGLPVAGMAEQSLAVPGLASGVAAAIERLIGLFRSLSPANGLSLTAAATLATLERCGPRRLTCARGPGGRDPAGHDAADRPAAGRGPGRTGWRIPRTGGWCRSG